MSVEAMSAVFKHSASKGCARLVLLAIANEANGDGLVTAYRRSQNYLAECANVDEKTVRRAIQALIDSGELDRLHKGIGRASSDYRILLPGLAGFERGQDVPSEESESPLREGEVSPQTPQDVPSIIPFSPVVSPFSPVGRSQAKRKSQLPHDFTLNETDRAYALTKMPVAAIDDQFERFQNHHWGHGTVMLDWRRAWRTWAGNFGKYDTKPRYTTDTQAELDRVFADRARAGT